MTENNPEPTEQQEPEAATPEQSEESGASREAAKYRRKLREVEAERDHLAEIVKDVSRRDAERFAADVLAKPSSMWAVGVDMTDLIGPGGLVDPDLVRAAATAARDEHGLAANPRLRSPMLPGQGRAEYDDQSSNKSFADAFAPKDD